MTKVRTYDEIETMFRDCEHLNEEYKAECLAIINATYHGMLNSVESPDKLTTQTPHGDFWVEAHNHVVELHHRYHVK